MKSANKTQGKKLNNNDLSFEELRRTILSIIRFLLKITKIFTSYVSSNQ